MNLFLKEIRNALKPLKLFLYVVTMIFIIRVYSTVFSIEEMSYSTLEFFLITFLLTSTTSIYLKYRNEVFLKLNELTFYNRNKIKLILFMVLLIEGIIVVGLYMVIFLMAKYLNILNPDSFAFLGNNGDLSFKDIYVNSADSYVYFIYAVVLEIMIIIAVGYTLNYFIKNRFLLNGILIIIIIYSMFFGNVVTSRVEVMKINATYYLVMINEKFYRNLFNTIVMPWNQVGMIAKKVFYNDDYYQVSWMNYSQMGIYSNLIWTPYASLVLMFFATKFIPNEIFKN